MLIHSTIIESNKSFIIHRRFDGNQPVQISVGSNQELSPVQIVAQSEIETGYEIVPVAEVLNLGPSEIDSYVKVNVGEEVRLGSLLVEYKRLFGRSRHITSKVEGTVAEIRGGNIFITRAPDEVNLRALVHGRVSQIIPNVGVAIQVKGSHLQGVWSNGKESAGNLLIQAEAPNSAALSETLNRDLFRSIVVLGHIGDANLLTQMSDSGARGVVAGTVSAEVYHAAAEWQLPFILTDGVGTGGMFPEMFQLLSENSGKDVALFSGKYGLSRRPDIVINHRSDAVDSEAFRQSRMKRAEPEA